MRRIHINLPEDIHETLKQMCDIECRSISAQVTYLIKSARPKEIEDKHLSSKLIGLTA